MLRSSSVKCELFLCFRKLCYETDLPLHLRFGASKSSQSRVFMEENIATQSTPRVLQNIKHTNLREDTFIQLKEPSFLCWMFSPFLLFSVSSRVHTHTHTHSSGSRLQTPTWRCGTDAGQMRVRRGKHCVHLLFSSVDTSRAARLLRSCWSQSGLLALTKNARAH